ncbi:HAMP domain-containing protein [Asticcacaulis sp. AC402]|uniref:HAMP domain-containing protein n=1 Tax=Asticcacaulis sp. AC402 TaxID=1282361 RepID=UPI0003FC8454|nr:HAMP domain-containing protein [Asticcacaulis sp. AC402]
MTIKAKILCLVAAFALLAATITGLSLKTMSDYNRIIAEYRHNSENAFRGERLNRLIGASAIEMRGVYLSESRAEELFQADRVEQRVAALEAFLNDWQTHLRPGELPELTLVRTDVMKTVKGGRYLAKLTREQGLPAADAYGNKDKYRISREAMQGRIDTMVSDLDAKLAVSQAELQKFQENRQSQFLLMAVSGILMLLGGSLWIAIDAIATPLARVRESMVRISEGAYDTEIPSQSRGEIGELWTALGILKDRAAEADRLSREQLEEEHRLRELVLD